ncbi:oxytocin-neurophysin 1-like [Polypterus senegalus]|uniref:oxytocin-neurophysin 1-like n=1 Tax=Polypterus senegalus TaxID=55291 RepID=UPI0019623C5E|nr:oxytocin-neurophysin 1-like [Polypterus senegalus]
MWAMPSFCALCLISLFAVSAACYISNCPIGGKRAAIDYKRCLSCGPGGRGHCFGPSICCGEELGCYIGTSETLICQEENYLPIPCESVGKTCWFEEEEGHCAAPGICCSEATCRVDSSCFEEPWPSTGSPILITEDPLRSGKLLLRLLKLTDRRGS